jgi:hypothetical protein
MASLGVVVTGATRVGRCECGTRATVPLEMLLRAARERNRRYLLPSPEELAELKTAARALIAAVVAGHETSDAVERLRHIGFVVVATRIGTAPALAIVEEPRRRQGRGCYVFRCGAVAEERIIQVPHSFFDEGTLSLGIEAARTSAARALFVNTVHRFGGAHPPQNRDESLPPSLAFADVAHASASAFLAVTAATLEALPTSTLFQLHGFFDRGDDQAKAEVVVSPGAAASGAGRAAAIVDELRQLLGADAAWLYPRDIHRLGGMTNRQGALVADHPPARFLHIELSRGLRDRMSADVRLRRHIARALIEVGR